MPRRLAAASAFVVFAVCLLGGMQADNTFVTVVSRALVAMVGTFVVGLIVGVMAQRMLEENLKIEAEKFKIREAKTEPSDR